MHVPGYIIWKISHQFLFFTFKDLASYDGDNDDVDKEYVCDEREQSTSALSDEWGEFKSYIQL